MATAIAMRYIKIRRDVDICEKIQKYNIINGVIMAIVILAILALGVIYIDDTITALEKCSITKGFNNPKYNCAYLC